MKFTESDIQGAYKIQVEKIGDERGYFARGFCQNEFRDYGITMDVVQANIGFNKHRYTIRGLHYQRSPHAEGKLVRCVRGAILDVFLDLRPESPSYKKWAGVELTESNSTMVYIPPGCAHGYQTLLDDTEIFYLVSSFYAPEYEEGIRWDDPAFHIQWRERKNVIVSEKDKSWPDFNDRTVFDASG